MSKMILCLLLVISSCVHHGTGQNGSGDPGGCTPIEIEPNDTFSQSTFLGVVKPPTQIVFCGDVDVPTDTDYYRVFTPFSELVSLVIENDQGKTSELSIYSHDTATNIFRLEGHFVGLPGQLSILDFPVVVLDDGFYFRLNNLDGPSKYDVTLWSAGIVIPAEDR